MSGLVISEAIAQVFDEVEKAIFENGFFAGKDHAMYDARKIAKRIGLEQCEYFSNSVWMSSDQKNAVLIALQVYESAIVKALNEYDIYAD